MRKGWIPLFICLMILPLALATLSVNNYTIETEYIAGEFISGIINLSISNEPADSIFSSNFDGEKTLEEFLTANGESNFCSTSACATDYSYSSPETTKTITLQSGVNQTIGFVLNGTNVMINSINFSISSDFAESVSLPLSVKLADSLEPWEYNYFSGHYGSQLPSYNVSAPRENQGIGSQEYCQKLNIPRTNSIRVKPIIAESSFRNLTMSLYTSDVTDIGECQYSNTTVQGCVIITSDVYYGDHYICVSDNSNQGLNLKKESVSLDNHGYTRISGPMQKTNVNYLIDVSAEKYASSTNLSTMDIADGFATAASNYIANKYDRDCSSSCIIPMTLFGIPQELVLSDLAIGYSVLVEETSTNFYSIAEKVPTVDFDGTLNMRLLDFSVDDDEFQLYFEDTELLDENLSVIESIILDVYPREVPAGVPIEFGIISESNLSNVNFEWYFGDDVNETSSDPSKIHTYNEIKNYTLIVIAKINNITDEKSFTISSVSPLEVIHNVLLEKREILDFLESKADNSSLPAEIKRALDLTRLNNELTAIAIEFSNSTEEANLSSIATALFELTIPINFSLSESQDFISPALSEVDLVALSAASGQSIPPGQELGYKASIQRWFSNNIEIASVEKMLNVEYESSVSRVEFRHYSLDIKSTSNTSSYLLINSPSSSLQFKSGVSAVAAGTSSSVELSPGYSQTLEFTVSGNTAPTMFVAPSPSILVLDEGDLDINEDCNFDGICGAGETSKNCRDDCRPRNLMVYYLILTVFLFLVSFFGVTIWYQRHKEEILFGDRRQLFNLVNFIKSAREKKLDDKKIEDMLIEKGWVIERVKYALEKSKKVDGVTISSFNNFIDKKVYAQSATPQIKQQFAPKINKPNSQNIRRRQ